MNDLRKTTIESDVLVKRKATADDLPNPSIDKMYIEFILCHVLPIINSNGDSFAVEPTKTRAKTVKNGYINLNHENTYNVGSILNAQFVEGEEGQAGRIECTGVLWKEVLKEFWIDVADITDGYYSISMEVLYKDFYYLVDGEKLDPLDNYHLEEYVGSTYEGKYVSRVITPHSFCGCCLTANPADLQAKIKRAVAEKKTKEEENMPYKVFEEEKDYNEHVNEIKTSYAEELQTNEEFIASIREGYVSIDDVLSHFEVAEAESVEDIAKAYATLKEEYEDYKKEIAEEKLYNKRVAELAEFDYEVAEDEKDEIINMSEASFNIIKKTAKLAYDKAKASVDDDEEPFDPNLSVASDDNSIDIIKSFQ